MSMSDFDVEQIETKDIQWVETPDGQPFLFELESPIRARVTAYDLSEPPGGAAFAESAEVRFLKLRVAEQTDSVRPTYDELLRGDGEGWMVEAWYAKKFDADNDLTILLEPGMYALLLFDQQGELLTGPKRDEPPSEAAAGGPASDEPGETAG